MERVEVLKMALASMPGANRLDVSNTTTTEEIINDSSGTKTVKSNRGKIKAGHGCWITDENGVESPVKYEPIFVYRKPGGNKSAKQSALEFAEGLTDLTKDFHRTLSSEKINLTWIRAIYAALERRIAEVKDTDTFKTFNKLRHHDLFITQKQLEEGKASVPQFTQRKVANHSSKKLVGKNIIIQFVEKKRSKINRFFAYAEVLPPQSGDNPGTAWVKISSSKKLAEKYWGLTMEINRTDILLVGSKPASFLTVDGNWSY
jgi:hypothetical protein